MVSTETRPSPTDSSPRRRLGAFIAGGLAAAIAIAIAIAVAGSGDDIAAPESAAEVMDRVQVAIEAADPGAFESLFTVEDTFGTSFLDWNLGLGMNPTFNDCAVESTNERATLVACSVAMGDEYFSAVVTNTAADTTLKVQVLEDGEFTVAAWPAPPGLIEAETEMRNWIRQSHPELEDQMFGFDHAGIIRFSKEAGELHAQYLDEFLAAR